MNQHLKEAVILSNRYANARNEKPENHHELTYFAKWTAEAFALGGDRQEGEYWEGIYKEHYDHCEYWKYLDSLSDEEIRNLKF